MPYQESQVFIVLMCFALAIVFLLVVSFWVGTLCKGRRFKKIESDRSELIKFAYDIRDNWDHDKDGHRYDTCCRVCEAQKILDAVRDKS